MKVYAIESGHIVRLKISPNKYGKAIYLQLDDGNIILYSHLDQFNPAIEKVSDNLRIKYSSSFFDHYLSDNEKIPITKGDIIGYTGDTGSLSGPHLHFEIRDSNNQPINPLINFYSIIDTTRPYAKSIAFIPFNNNSWINGIQDYQIIELKKINEYKYIFEDTISVAGKFGIAIETFDKINDQPFKFGIYRIEMYINNDLKYSIVFDKYNFKYDPLIYSEIDYTLMSENNKTYHRLFNSSSKDLLPFIVEPLNNLILDKGFHNMVINIEDANENKIQIQGVLSGNIEFPPLLSYHLEPNGNYAIEIDREFKIKTNFKLISRYDNISNYVNINLDSLNMIIDKNTIVNSHNVLEYTYKDNHINSRKSYLSLSEYNPFDIEGIFNIKYINKGIIIEFVENKFSGYLPKLIAQSSNNDTLNFMIYRKNINTLSSKIIDYDKIEDINKLSIVYNTKPEIIFNKNIKFLNENNNFTFDFVSLEPVVESEEETPFFWIEFKSNINTDSYDVLIPPFSINPTNRTFIKSIKLLIENNQECSNCGIFKYDFKNDKWIHNETIISNNVFSTDIHSGGIFAILKEVNAPIIENIFPNFNDNYSIKEINKLSFNIIDELSGVNPLSIEIYINKHKLFYDYIPYRNLVRTNMENYVNMGENSIEIKSSDKLNNSLIIKGNFNLIE